MKNNDLGWDRKLLTLPLRLVAYKHGLLDLETFVSIAIVPLVRF